MKMGNGCRIFVFALFGILILTFDVSGQDKKKITGDFQGLTFEQFANAVEAKTDFHFYFDITQFDSITVNVHASESTLPAILDQIFLNTSFHYSIDAENHVFVVKKFDIQTRLPLNFFERKMNAKDSIAADEFPQVETAGDKEREKLKASLENKLFEIGIKTNTIKPGNSTIAGYVRDIKTGEPLIGAAVYIDSPPIGVATDQFGYFSFTLPRGRHILKITSVGMKDTKRQVMLYADGKLNVDMLDQVASLKTVIVISEKASNTRSLQMGVERINIKTIKQVPVVFGEADVLRTVLTLPGVTSVGEGSTGFNVRGGAADQNLILFNDATVYNPSHLFGFFTAFNPDVVKDVELYKSSIPEKYGGRLASVLDVTTRDGNKKKISGTGGIGPLTSKLTIEGPLIKDKTSFIASVRTTYSDWLFRTLPPSEYGNSTASFYDLDLHISHEFNSKNNLYLTGYLSNDQFRLNNDTLYKYSNKNINAKYKHIFNNQLYGTLTTGYDRYQYSVSSVANPVNAFNLGFNINQSFLKADFSYSPGGGHNIDFGVNSIYYKLYPGSFDPLGSKSLVVPNNVAAEQGLESALYLGDRFDISPKFSVSAGIRYSMFNYLGPHDVYTYVPGLPREAANIVDSIPYPKGKFIKTYQGPEYRVSARYALSDNSSVKLSFNTTRQYIHMLTNTATISPTDIWKLSDSYIQPEMGTQYSLGYYQNFKSNTIETSLEVYYKNISNYLDYKSGATLLLNPHIETDVIETRGKDYGVEFMIKKLSGKLNGWLSYTYSRSLLQSDDANAGQTVNNGSFYPSDFDKPNNLNFIGNYKINHRFSISVNVVYSTGRPITLPIAIYQLGGSQRVYYSDRNQYRIPDYFRTDFSMNIEGNHKIKKLTHNSWTVGVYNLTARKNPYSVYFTEVNGVIKGYQLSIFGTAIPFITYNFRF